MIRPPHMTPGAWETGAVDLMRVILDTVREGRQGMFHRKQVRVVSQPERDLCRAHRRGSDRVGSVMTFALAQEARAKYRESGPGTPSGGGGVAGLAREYGVSRSVMRRIIANQIWLKP